MNILHRNRYKILNKILENQIVKHTLKKLYTMSKMVSSRDIKMAQRTV